MAKLQQEHVVMGLECLDRVYLSAYVPELTSEGGIAAFCRGYPERFAQEAIGHNSKAVQRVYARKVQVVIPIQEDYERKLAEANTAAVIVPMTNAAVAAKYAKITKGAALLLFRAGLMLHPLQNTYLIDPQREPQK